MKCLSVRCLNSPPRHSPAGGARSHSPLLLFVSLNVCFLALLSLHLIVVQLQQSVSRVQFLESSTVGRSIVSKQEARVCDLENKLEFQRGQVKRFEVRTHCNASYSRPCTALFKLCPTSVGAGVAFKGQRGPSGRGAGAERPDRGPGERERPILPAAPAGHEAGDGGADPEGAGQQPQTHGAGKKTWSQRCVQGHHTGHIQATKMSPISQITVSGTHTWSLSTHLPNISFLYIDSTSN